MKKIIQFVLLFLLVFSFFSIKNVYASNIMVCSNCEFRNLDEAFSAIEDGYSSDSYSYVYLRDVSGSYSFTRDYRFPQYVCIYQDSSVSVNRITIDGNGHTILANDGLFFMSNDAKLVLKNMDISSTSLNSPFAVGIGSYQTTVSADNISVTTSGRLRTDSSSMGISIYTYDFTLTNSTISNFAYAITNDRYLFPRVDSDSIPYYEFRNEEIGVYGNNTNITSVSIDSSDLYDNLFTIDGTFEGTIKNSRIASFSLFNEDRTNTNLSIDSSNDYGDVKIKRLDSYEFYNSGGSLTKSSSTMDEVYNQILNHDYLFVITDSYSNVEIEAKKNNSFNINNTKSVDLLSYFIDQEDINLRDYVFQVSDPSVASVENGQVVFLKSGEVDVTATNKNTGDVYTVHLKLESPNTSSNPKTSNSLIFLLIITILTLSSLFIFHKKQTNTL